MNLFRLNNRLSRRSLLLFAAGLIVLSLLTSWYFKIQPSVDYQQNRLQLYLNEQEKDAEKLLKDTVLLRKLVLNQESFEEFNSIGGKKYGLFLFAETFFGPQDLLFWNNQKIVPPDADFSLPDGTYFQRLDNGYFVVLKKTLRFSGMSNNIMAYVVIPVLYKYYLETNYLVTQFAHDENAVKQVMPTTKATEYPLHAAQKENLFFLERVAHPQVASTDLVSISLRLIALFLLLLFIHLQAETITRVSSSAKGMLFLVAAVIGIRVLMYLFPQLLSLRQFTLFDPSVYAANLFNRSLGDLLINAILLCWIIVFIWNDIAGRPNLLADLTRNQKYLTGAVGIFLLIFTTLQLAGVVYGLVVNSKISFNVTDFFNLDVYTIFGFIVLAILCLAYYYFTRILHRFIFPAVDREMYVYFAIAVLGLFFLTVGSGHSLILFQLPVLLWLLVYTFLLRKENYIIERFAVTVAGILFWIFIFSASLAVLILQGNRQNEIRERESIAQKYDRLTDPASGRILNIAMAYLDNRFLRNNFPRFFNPRENRVLRDSLTSENFAGYANRYDTKFYVFDSTNQSVNNDDSRTYADLNTIFTMQSKPTAIPGLFYHETSFDRFAYIIKRTVTDSTALIGTIYIISTPRQYGATDALYPELFRQQSKNDLESSSVYSYAIYNSRLLKLSSAKYPFQITLTENQVPKDEFERRDKGDYDELWYRANSQKVIVVAKKKDTFIESITLFSYLFCAFLFMVGIMQLFTLALKIIRDIRVARLISQVNIRTQIHGTIIFISILSFVVIGAATISFFIDRYERNNIDKLSRTAGITVKEVEKQVAEDNILNSEFTFYDSTTRANLKVLVEDIADIHNVDVNLYDLRGNLQVSSDEEVYKKGVLSSKMHPLAYYHLNNMREVQHVQEENMSTLEYLSIYSSIRDQESKVYAYLNIPYFSSQLDLKQEISNFLVTIINLNAFIFLIAGILALFITNKITQSFSVISSKMKEITLGRTNEEIAWNKNDEIGELIAQYNKMVRQLEQSAEALAKSEREGAWREMARQVAHEIKNPLTPMKLSIQYLQKAIHNNQSNVKELTTSVANTLIEQIDHLSKIAADFSQFANIGNKRISTVNLHQIIGSLVELYQSNPKIEIDWKKVEGELIMRTDKTHMNRLFTNLLTNAVDACSRKKKCIISINEERRHNTVIIAIKDNGEGIPADTRSKIFTPNFTTKTSGTGLGLAMCKSIVEQAAGDIWFETEEGEGTVFFVQLPVAK